jgi:CRP/FNR family transcriptional regulator, cyclic AMP receptor protein
MARTRIAQSVDLFTHDPELAALHTDGHQLLAPTLAVIRGPWRPPRRLMLVLRGAALRSVLIPGAEISEIVGPGDLIQPGQLDGDANSACASVLWTVMEPVTVAVLTERVQAALATHPALTSALARKGLLRAQRIAVQLAISGHPRCDQRVLLMLWQLADRFGRVTPEGVLLPLRLSHRVLGDLVRARRPTVTTSLKQLADSGAVIRTADGHWLLAWPTPRDRLAQPQGAARSGASAARQRVAQLRGVPAAALERRPYD